MIEVEIEVEAWSDALPDPEAVVRRAAEAVLAAHEGGGDVVVLLTGDGEIQDLNSRFRGKDSATNVLSFPAAETSGDHLGDVALAYGVCAREAAEQGKTLANHLAHLTAHGVLHLLGYDHETDAEAEAMESLERAILAPLGVPDPYGEPKEPGATAP